jgi:aspartyl/asparaginyl beta-hydroxylase (cupin superfamily)
VSATGNNGRPERLLAVRERLDLLVSGWRERHPAASLERIGRFVRVIQGRVPHDDGPPGQRPDLLRFPGLTARPWRESEEFPWVALFERGWREVRAELDALLAQPGSFAPFADGDGAAYREEKFGLRDRRDAWTVFDCLSDEGAARCPRTAALIHGAIADPFLANFSRLRPGTHLPAHCGLVNYLLTIHLGVDVPEGCTIRVGSETRTWREGRCLIFDDSFEHEVWHRGATDRVILLVRFPHPDLTALELDCLAGIEGEVGALLGGNAEERKTSLDLLRRMPG